MRLLDGEVCVCVRVCVCVCVFRKMSEAVPGGFSHLSVQLWLRSRSHSLVRKFKPRIRIDAVSAEPASDPLPPSLSAPSLLTGVWTHNLSLKNKQIIKKNNKDGHNIISDRTTQMVEGSDIFIHLC